MKIQLNNGIISDLSFNAVVATNAGDIDVDNVPTQPFDYDYVNGEFVRMRWSDWHELTNYQIKFDLEGLTDMIEVVPAMAYYTNTLTTHRENGFRYFYVNYIDEQELPLIKMFAEIYNRMGERL